MRRRFRPGPCRVRHRLRIVVGQRLHRAGLRANAAGVGGAWVDEDEIRAEAVELRLDGGLRALADRHQRDDGADADDHAQHRQRRPQLVGHQRGEGDLERLTDVQMAILPSTIITPRPEEMLDES